MKTLEKRIEFTEAQIKIYQEQLDEELKSFKNYLENARQDKFLQDNVSENARTLITTLEGIRRRIEINELQVLKHKEVLKVLTSLKEEE